MLLGCEPMNRTENSRSSGGLWCASFRVQRRACFRESRVIEGDLRAFPGGQRVGSEGSIVLGSGGTPHDWAGWFGLPEAVFVQQRVSTAALLASSLSQPRGGLTSSSSSPCGRAAWWRLTTGTSSIPDGERTFEIAALVGRARLRGGSPRPAPAAILVRGKVAHPLQSVLAPALVRGQRRLRKQREFFGVVEWEPQAVCGVPDT